MSKLKQKESGMLAALTKGTEHNGVQEQIEKNQSAIELLRMWRSGDEQEQRQTLEYLRKALDEDRLSNRKLFS